MPRQDATTWKPDTCGCRFYLRGKPSGEMEYLNYNAVKAEHLQRINAKDPTANPKLAPPDEVCQTHANLGYSMGKPLFNAVKEEGNRKNFTLEEARRVIPTMNSDNYNWSFDANRKLTVGFLDISISSTEKAQVQAHCDARFGAGKVEVI